MRIFTVAAAIVAGFIAMVGGLPVDDDPATDISAGEDGVAGTSGALPPYNNCRPFMEACSANGIALLQCTPSGKWSTSRVCPKPLCCRWGKSGYPGCYAQCDPKLPPLPEAASSVLAVRDVPSNDNKTYHCFDNAAGIFVCAYGFCSVDKYCVAERKECVQTSDGAQCKEPSAARPCWLCTKECKAMGRCRQASTGGLYCAYSQNAHQTSVNPRGLPEAEEDRRLGCLEGALTCHSSRRSIVKCQGGAWHNDQKCDEHCAQPDDEKMAPFCVDGTKASRSVTDGAATESLGVPDYGSCDRNQVGRSSCRDDRSSILFCTVDRRLVKKEDCGKGHCRISRHSGIAICGREGGGGLEQRSVADVVSITDLSATENDEDVSTDQTTQGLALSLAVMAIDDEHDSGTNDRKICTPGHKQCALTWNRKSVIKVCLSHGKALQQIKTCGKKGCCIEDLVSGTASCTCSQARSTTENEENGENEQSMEVSASDQGRPDNCTPGTYRCALTMDRQHSVIQVCALTNNWVRSVICGDPRCCHDSPVFGSSYCMY